jgi:hypothetical protein
MAHGAQNPELVIQGPGFDPIAKHLILLTQCIFGFVTLGSPFIVGFDLLVYHRATVMVSR